MKAFWHMITTLTFIGLLSGCGSDGATNPHNSSSPSSPVVRVAYAGSLQLLNNRYLGPAFEKISHARYQGQGGGSYGLAHEIASGSLAANVFESIGYGPIGVVEPAKMSWALAVASSPLVLAYNPHSPFASALNQIRQGQRSFQDLFHILAEPGFKLGRTNPNTDPQGQAFVMAIQLAQQQYHLSSRSVYRILGPTTTGPEIYTEEGILSLLQSGGLDASSAFLSEAVQRHLDYIPFPSQLNFSSPQEARTYHKAHITLSNGTVISGAPLTIDVTTIGHPPSPKAIQFVEFLLSSRGKNLLKQEGYTVFRPYAVGNINALPQALRQDLNHVR